MWRFITVSFAFLGLAFYQLSGGSDYEPASNSIQARAIERAAERSGQITGVVQVSAMPATEPAEPIETAQPQEVEVAVTLASVSEDDSTLMPNVATEPSRLETVAAIDAAIAEVMNDTSPVTADEEGIDTAALAQQNAVFSLESYAEAVENGTLIVSADGTAQLPEGDTDIRQVSGKVVNMRSGPGKGYGAVGKLKRGTEVVVLDEPGNGWVRLQVVETGVQGWMADWLVTAAN